VGVGASGSTGADLNGKRIFFKDIKFKAISFNVLLQRKETFTEWPAIWGA
jgi:hypothetical protein